MERIVIIGAGPAGLTTAYKLLTCNKQKDIQVVVVEKSSQCGGISKTIDYKGNKIDLGGHRFFTKNEEIKNIWLELLPAQGAPISDEVEPTQGLEYTGTANPNMTDDVMLLRRRISRIYFNGKFFDYPITISLNTLRNLGFFTSVKCGFGYFKAKIFKEDESSLEGFYINRFGKPLYEMFFKGYTTKLWGVSPAQLDSSWGSQRVKELSLLSVLKDFVLRKTQKRYQTSSASLIEQFYYPKFGPGQLWEKMAGRIEELGGIFLYNTECVGIVKNERIEKILVKNEEGSMKALSCDWMVSSAPIKELVSFFENVSDREKKIAANLPYRDFITVGILLHKLSIKNNTEHTTANDLPPDCWIYVQDDTVKVGRIQIFNNWSPYLPKSPKDTVWLGMEFFCFMHDEFWEMSDNNIFRQAILELKKMGIVDSIDVLDYVVLRQEKAYPAYYGTYQQFGFVKTFLQNQGNLICVGRNGQHRYNNMDHSMLTGILAAEKILGNKTVQNVWEVNTEQTYCEDGSKR